jgi:hypothetical protein
MPLLSYQPPPPAALPGSQLAFALALFLLHRNLNSTYGRDRAESRESLPEATFLGRLDLLRKLALVAIKQKLERKKLLRIRIINLLRNSHMILVNVVYKTLKTTCIS